ncbi:MAG TPA: hypothetical protein HA252_06570 [Candidatus Diapherotrites archaeon]|uniref:Uncharacterized protein n=1 Tax=Candidatus Iainarchaeum sp. TaxID=3101447 RepID=A0A7J4JH17_9ARCH|nr:hypothetical protein [Candidatus Diapherotrites archaeon]HIH17041.1 hypothetical protein [Candidatus Diapherotrites archaeon]
MSHSARAPPKRPPFQRFLLHTLVLVAAFTLFLVVSGLVDNPFVHLGSLVYAALVWALLKPWVMDAGHHEKGIKRWKQLASRLQDFHPFKA